MDYRRQQVFTNAALTADQNCRSRSGDLARVLKQLQRLRLNRNPNGEWLRFGRFGLHDATEVTSSCARLQPCASVRLSCVREPSSKMSLPFCAWPAWLYPPATAQDAHSPPTSTAAPGRN